MKSIATALALAAAALAAPLQETPTPRQADTDPHAWLMQFLGDWEASAESVMEPGAEPLRWESTEHVRAIGDHWIVAEGSASFDGEAFASLMTLGHDPAEGAFVGSWIDSIQTRMWTYRGELDDARRALTLSAEGPSIVDPSVTASYRDRLELVDADHRRLVSSIRLEDGTWQTYLTVDYRRKK